MFGWEIPFDYILVSVILLCSVTMTVLSAVSIYWVIEFRKKVANIEQNLSILMETQRSSMSTHKILKSTMSGKRLS